MRKTIRQILVDSIPQVESRVYEPHAAGPTIKKPYLVLKEGVQDPEADWSAFSTIIEVWPYVSRTTFQQVDALANQVIDTLHRTRFAKDGEQYLIDYIGSAGPDFVDAEWDAITRGLRFRVFSLGWLDGLTYDPDPVAALQDWTKDTWPNEAHIDPSTWSPMDDMPGIYWRLVRSTTTQTTAAVNWLEAQINGHILAPSASVRLTWIRKVTEGLTIKRRLKMSDGGPLELLKVAVDSEADPMRKGQIQIITRFGVLQPKKQVEKLRRAMIGGDIPAEVTKVE